LNYLEENGEDLSSLYEVSPLPIELLKDPSYWMSAPTMEYFLQQILKLPLKNSKPDLYTEIGHQNPFLLSWGVLDSVLKMVPEPHEVFKQPARFLSYFISPEPPIENLVSTDQMISLDLPLPAEQYPLVTSYLVAAFEALPLYVGQALAKCEWSHIHLKIQWSAKATVIPLESQDRSLNSEWLQGLVEDLQKSQQLLEEKNRELMLRNEELLRSQKNRPAAEANSNMDLDLRSQISSLDMDLILGASPIHQVNQNLARLHDYMVRAQQLITLLLSQSKMSSGLKEILRRVDWDHVKAQYPMTISESVEALRELQKNINIQNEKHQSSPSQENKNV
jgi:hypothetical protein